jgi:hypothetical protein
MRIFRAGVRMNAMPDGRQTVQNTRIPSAPKPITHIIQRDCMTEKTQKPRLKDFPKTYWVVILFEFFERGSYYGMMSIL